MSDSERRKKDKKKKKKKKNKAVPTIPWQFAKAGNLNGLIGCVDDGGDVDAADEHSMTALLWASAIGMPDMVRYLVEQKADVTATNESGWSCLMCAALRCHDDCVDVLLETKSNVDACDQDGKTALMCASVVDYSATENDEEFKELEAQNIRVIKSLLKGKADIDKLDNLSTSALTWACVKSNHAAVKALLDNDPKPDLDWPNVDSLTALMWACQTGSLAVCEMLVDAKANVNAVDSDGWTPLMWAAKLIEPEQVPDLPSDATEEEVEDYTNLKKVRALEAAEMNRFCRECITVLIAHGADIDHQDKKGKTALMWCSETANTDAALLLLESGADFEKTDANGQTAITLAESFNTFKAISDFNEKAEAEGCKQVCEACTVC